MECREHTSEEKPRLGRGTRRGGESEGAAARQPARGAEKVRYREVRRVMSPKTKIKRTRLI